MGGGLFKVVGVAALLAGGGAAGAETLRGALVQTYQSNPTLNAERANVRTTDESVAIARAQGRPQVSGTAGVNQDLTRTGGGNGRSLSAGVAVSYPLFAGGRVRTSIRATRCRRCRRRPTRRSTSRLPTAPISSRSTPRSAPPASTSRSRARRE